MDWSNSLAIKPVCIYTLEHQRKDVYLYTNEVAGRYKGPDIRRLGTGGPKGQPRSIQTSNQTGSCDRPASEEGHPAWHTTKHRETSRSEVEVTAGEPRRRGVNLMRQYIALIHKDADSDYGVSFPDLPGVISAGSTLDEARDMASEALALHIEGLIEDGEAIPEASSLEDVMANAENRDGVAVLISAPATAVKSVRVNVTLPSDVLEQIDEYAEREGFTRSGFLAQAAKKAMVA